MTAVVYGPLRIPPAVRPAKPLPAPERVAASVGQRRRRYGVVCPSLTVDGHTIGPFAWHERAAMRRALGIHPRTGTTTLAIRCAHRPGDQVAPIYVMDVCLTFACQDCPFQPDARPAPAPPIPSLLERRLADIRDRQRIGGWDDSDLGELAGIATEAVTRALRGAGLPFVVERLAAVLGVAW